MGHRRPTGYLFHEIYMWHSTGELVFDPWLQPCRHWEDAETRRRMHNLISASGMLDILQNVKPRQATLEELCYFHTSEYVTRVENLSNKGGGEVGLETTISPGGYEIAAMAAGGAIAVTDAVLAGECVNAYALVRPPGHHATRSSGVGFCVFNNIVIAAEHALRKWRDKVCRIAILDFDVHHGNGTEEAFIRDDRVLYISVHQSNNFPVNSGTIDDYGFDEGVGFTINVPLPAGSGSAAYSKVMSDIVVPAFDAFKPDLILASCGFDASYLDPLGRMTLGSGDFVNITETLMAEADKHCNGRVVMFHEGGCSEVYVPFCGLAVLEALSGESIGVVDPLQEEQRSHDGGHFPDHQKAVIEDARGVVKVLEKQCEKRKPHLCT